MKLLLLLVVFTSCAVNCDDSNNYYVIRRPEEIHKHRLAKKPFRVYWNVPTFQCKSKKVDFQNLNEKYGIIQNKNDSFRGDKVAILYDPGNFPALLKNETSGKFEFRNGGVPQEGSLEKHEAAFRSILEQSIPDQNFNGVGIIDFESWRPIFRQNFGSLSPYKDISYEIERKRHIFWPTAWVEAEAKKRFDTSARIFMQRTIAIARALRPYAMWGYYGFPYCFNTVDSRCASKMPEENDKIDWLWSESTALYPSLYGSQHVSASQLADKIRGRVAEAARVRRRGSPILPYFWFRYRDGPFLTEEDLSSALKALYRSNAAGFILWGASADVNTLDKCLKLKKYIDDIMGPAIAKYTINNRRDEDDDYMSNDINQLNNATESPINLTTANPVVNEGFNINETNNSFKDVENTTTIEPLKSTNEMRKATTEPALKNIEPDLADPEDNWKPPENYTEDIKQYVEDQYMKKNKSEDSLLKIFRRGFLASLFNKDRMDESNLNDKNGFINGFLDRYLSNVENKRIATTDKDLEIDDNTNIYEVTTVESNTRIESDSPINAESVNDPLYLYTNDEYFNIETSTHINDYNSTKNITDESDMDIDLLDIESNIDNTTELLSYDEIIFEHNITEVYTTDSSYGINTDNDIKTEYPLSEFLTIDVYNDTIINRETSTEKSKSEIFLTEDLLRNDDLNDDITASDSNDYDWMEVSTNGKIVELHDSTTDATNIEADSFETETEFSPYMEAFTDIMIRRETKNQRRNVKDNELTSQNGNNLENLSKISDLEGMKHEKVSSGASQHYFCLFFYFYSVSKCLCDYYAQC